MIIELVESTEENKLTEEETAALIEKSARAWQIVHRLDDEAKARGIEPKWKDYFDMVMEVARLTAIPEKDFNQIYMACGFR